MSYKAQQAVLNSKTLNIRINFVSIWSDNCGDESEAFHLTVAECAEWEVSGFWL